MAPESRNPFDGVSDFFTEMARMREMGIGRREYDQSSEPRQRTHATAWVPATDIFARGEDLVIRLDLAGVAPDHVTITFANNTITVQGERLTDDEAAGPESFYVRERFHGAFRRAITVPSGIESDQIEAEFLDGLVEITVTGGLQGVEPHRIELRSSGSRTAVSRSVGKGTRTPGSRVRRMKPR